MAPTDHDRPRSDGPFAPDEALFGWSPKRSAVVVLVVALGLLVSAWSHHHDYRLAPHESGATLERGVFAPWGWDEWVPEGGESAWIPVPWSLGDDAPPLEGELGDLADVFADLLTEQVEASLGDPEAVSESLARVEAFSDWYQERYAQAPAAAARAKDIVLAHQEAQAVAVAAERAAEEARRQAILAAQAAEEAERRRARLKAYRAERRALLIRVEDFLARLPRGGEGTRREEADRAALEILVRTMDSPLPGTPPAQTGDAP